MFEIFIKFFLVAFLVFYVIDYILYYLELDFAMKRFYKKTKIYGAMRRMGFWGRLNMFCPGTRISYYHYKVTNKDGDVIFEFPDYREVPWPKQMTHYRWRKLGYGGLKKRKEIFLRNLVKESGYSELHLHETKILMPSMIGDKLKTRETKVTTTSYPKNKENDK